MNIYDSARGRYEVTGDPATADMVIVHSFGTSLGEGSPNHELAKFALNIADGRVIVGDRSVVNAFPNKDDDVGHVVEGPITNAIGQGVGTWGALVVARRYMQENDLHRPIMVAQAHHIGRVVRQGLKLGIDFVVPEDLPANFDLTSGQWCTRSEGLWVPREVLGSLVLRAKGQL